MSIKIAGILEDGAGNPIPNCIIELKAKKTTLKVIAKTEANILIDRLGAYSINVNPGEYSVTLYLSGYPKKEVGDIQVYSDSRSGSLNDFLMLPEESDLTPEIVLIFQQLRDEAKEAAEKAKISALSASESAANATNSATAAAESETNADASAQLALQSAENAASSEAAAAKSETNADTSAQSASESAVSAANSATAAAESELIAESSAKSASESETNAAGSAAVAAGSEERAAASASSASISAINATNSATAAMESETKANSSAESASLNVANAMNSAAAAAKSETNAEASAQSASENAASAAISAKAALESETNAGISAEIATSEANRAKSEADKAIAVTDSKQDKLDISELGKEIIVAETAEDTRRLIGAASDEDLTTLSNQLGNAAFKNLGTIADTVAAGDDPRLDTVDKKTGGEISGSLILDSGFLGLNVSSNYGQSTIDATVAGGLVVDWGSRGTALLVSMPYADTQAYSIFKAVQWGRAWLYGMDVHYPPEGTVQVIEHLGGLATFTRNSDGNSYQQGSVTCNSVIQTSDINNKDNITIIENALDKLSQLSGNIYTLKNSNEVSAGIIAQELKEILPESVKEIKDINGNVSLAVEYNGVTALLVESVKELQRKLVKQEKEIEKLKKIIFNI